MKERFTCLVLLLLMAGGAFAGVSLHSGESECSMGSMMDMDCCKAALLQKETPEVANAKLCCTLNCAQSGITSVPSNARVSPPSQVSLPVLPASAVLPPSSPLRYLNHSHRPPSESQPAYIRHLALLI